eukprot:TRINITY_DN3277_c0_g1_i1.p1 TRINITY_DN3277_c0_g1~~TRINITY_DN3277_c0_g1_i1.p1  ORF type:complete len:268 (+),score=19.78 TRINITY_DN3277_c0_g1_i1:480-1283(+)
MEMARHDESKVAAGQAMEGSMAVSHYQYWSQSSAGESVITIEEDSASLEHHPSSLADPALQSSKYAPLSPPPRSTTASIQPNNSSLQHKVKPLGRIKTSIRLLLVLIDLVTDLIFLVECYQPGTLNCLTYSAFPENEKKRQRLHNGIFYGAWACAGAAAIEFTLLCFLYRWQDYEPPSKLSGLIAFLGGCHDTVQVVITFLFNWYLGAGSLVAAISMLVSALMILLHWIQLFFKLEGVTLLSCCQCLCWGPCAYGLGVIVLLFGECG